ncbi:substrate-binding periplasmic protein [Marinobacter sp.]|uniref:substrate-binding periplasmic protein n=1 Tax=Marinobacter sp. TaxID=50741 RepID=UPI0038502491
MAILTSASGTLHGEQQQTLLFNIAPDGYPPYTIQEDDGEIRGIFWDVLSEVAHRLGHELEVVEIPTKRVETMLLAGELDVTMRAREWTDEPEKFVFSDPVVTARDVLFTRRADPLNITSPSELKGIVLIAHHGYHYPILEPMIKTGDITLLELQDEATMFRRLAGATRFDALVTNYRAGMWLLEARDWQNKFRVEPVTLNETPYPLMFAPRHAAFVERFNRELASMKASGELAEILGRYQ